MSRNAYALFEKHIFLEMGGMGEVHLEWGGHEMIIPKGGDSCTAEGRAKKGSPPQPSLTVLNSLISLRKVFYQCIKLLNRNYPYKALEKGEILLLLEKLIITDKSY